jgi:hypothetical protein
MFTAQVACSVQVCSLQNCTASFLLKTNEGAFPFIMAVPLYVRLSAALRSFQTKRRDHVHVHGRGLTTYCIWDALNHTLIVLWPPLILHRAPGSLGAAARTPLPNRESGVIGCTPNALAPCTQRYFPGQPNNLAPVHRQIFTRLEPQTHQSGRYTYTILGRA